MYPMSHEYISNMSTEELFSYIEPSTSFVMSMILKFEILVIYLKSWGTHNIYPIEVHQMTGYIKKTPVAYFF